MRDPLRSFAAIACVFVSALISARSGYAQDLAPARVVPIQINGDPATHFSLVILGDGYTAAEMRMFREHVDKHLNILWSFEPFKSYRNYINVYAVEIASPESGITCDPAHRQHRNTPLGLYFDGGCTDPNARGILVAAEQARRYARLATPDFDQILIIANSDTYGGIGGSVATTSGGNSLSPYITPHELGHSLGRLQDEYTYYTRGVPGGAYAGKEPESAHHTLLTVAQMKAQQKKWWRWLDEPSEAGGIIGAFEGGSYKVSGIWRPSRHSMMISLGYEFDQVSREQLADRISRQVRLIAASTNTDSIVPGDAVIWIAPAHPVHASLDTRWSVDGAPLPSANGAITLDLAALRLQSGRHTVSVTASDTTSFVRDPEIRAASFTATRSWNVDASMHVVPDGAPPVITGSTPTNRPVGGTDVVFVDATHPDDHELRITWTLDGRAMPNPQNRFDFNLARANLARGAHTLRAVVTDPVTRRSAPAVSWSVDNTPPVANYAIGGDTASFIAGDGARRYFVRDSFTFKLNATDDRPGYLVTEFRVNRDGWHHFYGWPDAPEGEPFHFTARGTTIKELVYGSLGAEGLSPQPWETRAPGWGYHDIEYRALDAAGNFGSAKHVGVEVQPSPECTSTIHGSHSGDIAIASGTTCLVDATVRGSISVAPAAALVATRAHINGGITADSAAMLQLVNTDVTGAAGVTATRGSLILFGSAFHGGLHLRNNGSANDVRLAGNRVNGSLSCDVIPASATSADTPAFIGNSAACGTR